MPVPRLFLIVAAAGVGTRVGAAMAKQYVVVHGQPLIAHALAHLRVLDVARTIVAISPDDREWSDAFARGSRVDVARCGGATRAQTVRNAVDLLAGGCSVDDFVLVHDAARALVPADALLRLVGELADDDVGGLLALPVADTLKRADGAMPPRSSGTADRHGLWQAQTPQMFRFGKLRPALHLPLNADCTDEAQAMERAGHAPRLVRGSAYNLKVTIADDLAIAAAIFAAQNA
ncbi:MAG: 2-C-methyl-D-erythritol 4-phosphate cytidylyltransferase [Betaproteobacteria bacterium]